MYKIGDIVMHQQHACKLTELASQFRDGKDFYVLTPINDDDMKIYVPVDHCQCLRPVIKKKEAERLIDRIGEIEIIDESNSRALETIYKELMKSPNLEDIVRIIKTAHARTEARKLTNQQFLERDKMYFHAAEKVLFNEFSIALGISYDEVKERIADQLAKTQNE